jgi:hypothetical protein
MTRTTQSGKTTNREQKRTLENELWPEEEQALKDIKTGKVVTRKQTGRRFLEDLSTMINE